MITTTGTSIEAYLDWIRRELESKEWGEVSIRFTVCRHQVTDVRKESVETEHRPLKPLEEPRIEPQRPQARILRVVAHG